AYYLLHAKNKTESDHVGKHTTPCTYTECILSVFFSGIPSVYVTGGHTVLFKTSIFSSLQDLQTPVK
ncbi:hypothetical protein L9F63_020480, partial [Diploptera punctata]